MRNGIDLAIIAVYLVGTTLLGCSFFFRKDKGDGARTFMTGGGRLPTWAIALSVFATHVSSISFLALPEGAYARNWWGWINSITVPIATLVAAIWFVPFYRRATSVSAYSFLESRFGAWARIYASACFLIMQSARSGIILLLLAILVNQLLGFSYESIILVTGIATLVYSMMGGFAAVVWADAIQSLILIVGTLVCVICLLVSTPDLAANAQAAWEAGKISFGSMSLSDWSTNTFWVLFIYSICINLQNFGVDQCYTQRYVAARDAKAAARSIWGSACLYVPVTLLFTIIGTLLWMYNHATGAVPEGMKAAEVFPWFIMHHLPTGVSGLLVAAIIAAAMSTVAATLNSGSTVLLEDYWKRFCPSLATARGNMVFLRAMTVLLALVSIGIALTVVWIWGKDNSTVLGLWYMLQGVLSGGMLGLFLIGAFARRARAVHAFIATACGLLAIVWVTFGQKILPLPWVFHVNMSIVFATLAIVVLGFALPAIFSSSRNLMTLFAVWALVLLAGAKEPMFPEQPSPTIRQRQETLETFRLLERDIRFHAVPREERDINGNTNVPFFQPPANETVNAQALIWPQDRDPLDVLLRRTRALADDLKGDVAKEGDDKAAAFGALCDSLKKLEDEAAATPVADADARYALFERAMRLRRKIAFSNPLLKDIDKLLFITRETPTADELSWGTHMCDQYFGFHATLKASTFGNGIWTLEEPFGEEPRLKELTPPGTKIRSSNPDWNGCAITREGGFLAPDLSWDGKEILFCWTPGDYRTREWDEKTTFHIMKMKADGSNLTMLTWGGVNDLFPCWLPNGRILFVSERRGGFGRCHMREVPNFTLHSMFPDGTDIVCLSPHETNEWEPSVDNDGMVVYTRWDYTDRGFNQAHHAWITYPDGRDPRELNGNTRLNQRRAPHMVQSIRAIPGSRRYVAVSCGHHTPDRGSLVLLDPSVPDDGEMGQVKRLTPEVLLPEAEKLISWPIRPSGCYGAPWPLSEKYYLCTYDGDGNGQYSRLLDYQRRKYCLTLLDAFGNKIRIFEHPTISCSEPIPLRARKMPPVIPHRTLFGRPADPDGNRPEAIPESQLPQTAAYGLVNVYNSRYPFPKGVKITALRVWQVFPKTEPLDGHPRLGVIDQMGGRQCLGTVPVEADGSAHFSVPVKTPVYFQALDEDGCAVQSMRTVAYAQAGERLTCNGCHESRHGRAAAASAAAPQAFRRPPSELTPEPEGSKPFNYPRLVQGVLDAKCVSCHGEKRNPAKMPDLRAGDIWLNPYCFNTSFIEIMSRGLVHYYSERYVGPDWWTKSVQGDQYVQPYTEPGKVGARASRLYAKIKNGHKGVRLTDEEMRRLVVFMDSHGSYISHDTRALDQCLGKVVEGVNFPPPRRVPVLADGDALVVGDSLVTATAACTAFPQRGACAVVVPGRLSDATRKIYAARKAKIVENATLLRVVRGRYGFVTGVVVRLADGQEAELRGHVILDATGDGRICRETGAPMEDGHFLPGPDFCYPYLPQGSKNVVVADATAAVPRDEVPKILSPEGQAQLGKVLAIEIRTLRKAISGLFTVRGR